MYLRVRNLKWRVESHPLTEHCADYKCYESNPGEEMKLSGRLVVAVHFDSQFAS